VARAGISRLSVTTWGGSCLAATVSRCGLERLAGWPSHVVKTSGGTGQCGPGAAR
jgi:hypothetical protein